jgi:hypothetical protein
LIFVHDRNAVTVPPKAGFEHRRPDHRPAGATTDRSGAATDAHPH